MIILLLHKLSYFEWCLEGFSGMYGNIHCMCEGSKSDVGCLKVSMRILMVLFDKVRSGKKKSEENFPGAFYPGNIHTDDIYPVDFCPGEIYPNHILF